MEFAQVTPEILIFLFSAALIAGFLDTLAGGGGLIALPALIISGIPPLAALGTNKLQGTTGTATATLMMLRSRTIRWPDVKYLMLFAFIGSMAGTIAVQFINTEVLTFVIPVVLFCIAIYFLTASGLSRGQTEPRISKSSYQKFVIPIIGWYDGMFGPGAGSFLALAGVSLRGQTLIDSTATAKALNFSTNIASLIIFLLAGEVVWLAGLLMIVGQVTGAWFGSKCLLRIDPRLLRPLVVIMCVGMLTKYGFSMGWFD